MLQALAERKSNLLLSTVLNFRVRRKMIDRRDGLSTIYDRGRFRITRR
jgi:hypothetical protein